MVGENNSVRMKIVRVPEANDTLDELDVSGTERLSEQNDISVREDLN